MYSFIYLKASYPGKKHAARMSVTHTHTHIHTIILAAALIHKFKHVFLISAHQEVAKVKVSPDQPCDIKVTCSNSNNN